MRLKKSQLLRIIKENLRESVDGGRFDWPEPPGKPWWANSIEAQDWDVEANAIYDLKEHNRDLVEKFEDAVGEHRPTGTVTGGEPEIETPRERRRSRRGRGEQQAVRSEPESASSLPSGIQMFRDLHRGSRNDLRRSQSLFDNLCQRYFIGKQLERLGDSEGREIQSRVINDDVKFLVGYSASDSMSMSRRGIVLSALQDEYRKEKTLLDEFIIYAKRNQPDLPVATVLAGEEAGGISGEIRGNQDEEALVWTLRDSPDDPWKYRIINGKWHASKRAGTPRYIDISDRPAAVKKLNDAKAAGSLEGNPMSAAEERAPVA